MRRTQVIVGLPLDGGGGRRPPGGSAERAAERRPTHLCCPVRLDGVVVGGTTLHGQIVVPGSVPDSARTADANPHSFVVAVERSLLPAGPFVVQLNATDPPVGAPMEGTAVDVDLSGPGSTASAAPPRPGRRPLVGTLDRGRVRPDAGPVRATSGGPAQACWSATASG